MYANTKNPNTPAHREVHKCQVQTTIEPRRAINVDDRDRDSDSEWLNPLRSRIVSGFVTPSSAVQNYGSQR